MISKSPSKKELVAVTGASGHLGVNLVRALLAEGRKVRILEHMDSPGLDGLDLDIIEGDVLDEKSLSALMDGADAAYHLAAKIYLGPGHDEETSKVNVLGTRNVAKACIQAKVKRLVHFSSIHALSPEPFDSIVDENRPCLTKGSGPCYDYSKAAAEHEIYDAMKLGLDAVILNPGGVIGPFDFRPSFMGQLLLDMENKRFLPLCQGGFQWVDARDVVAAALTAEKHGKTGERYLLAGEWLSLLSIADIVSECSSKKMHHFELPVSLASVIARLVETYGRITNSHSSAYTMAAVHSLQNYRFVSSEKAKKEIGFAPRPIKQTISDTLKWYKEAKVPS